MLRGIGRLLLVFLAFAIAAGVALFVLFTLGSERLVQSGALERIGEGGLDGALGTMLNLVIQAHFLVSIASALTLVPAVLLVIVGEVAGIRSSLYYVLGGGAAMAAAPVLSGLLDAADRALPSATLLQIFATAGFAAGLVYWLLAGRRA